MDTFVHIYIFSLYILTSINYLSFDHSEFYDYILYCSNKNLFWKTLWKILKNNSIWLTWLSTKESAISSPSYATPSEGQSPWASPISFRGPASLPVTHAGHSPRVLPVILPVKSPNLSPTSYIPQRGDICTFKPCNG